ncbi:hypothetical protein [Paenibacillus tengchongensis]|uniref:hypothetical protein n=1 Tax=Paenibacillus tengchongensis TaxID=2608684 RepID=UPI00124F612B|nr:hypothetical protein [Paenibacillus tengchongensis]
MDTWIYFIITLLYLGLLMYGLTLFLGDSIRSACYSLLAVTAALVWDNGVMAAGTTIGEGDLLESLNLARYWLHAFCTPLLVLVSYDLIRRTGSPWAATTAARGAAWLFTAGLIIMELATHTFSLQLRPVLEYGALRYVPAEETSGPSLLVILIMIPLFTAGVVLWKRKVTSLLFWGTLIMLAGSAIPVPLESSAATNVLELILIASLWLAIRAQQRQSSH